MIIAIFVVLVLESLVSRLTSGHSEKNKIPVKHRPRSQGFVCVKGSSEKNLIFLIIITTPLLESDDVNWKVSNRVARAYSKLCMVSLSYQEME